MSEAERIRQVSVHAEQVFGSREKAERFLTTSHMLLDGQKPIDVAVSESGARRVEQILGAIVHGVAP